MGWLDASDYLVMDIATRNRVDELRSAVDMNHAHGRARWAEPRCTRRLRRCMVVSAPALIVGFVALAAGAGCATGTRSASVDTRERGTVTGQASPATAGDEIPTCRDGSYDRAAGLCVSEGK